MLLFYPATASLKGGCYKALDPALPGRQYQISFSRPWEAELSVLEEGQVLLVPHLQCICAATGDGRRHCPHYRRKQEYLSLNNFSSILSTSHSYAKTAMYSCQGQ